MLKSRQLIFFIALVLVVSALVYFELPSKEVVENETVQEGNDTTERITEIKKTPIKDLYGYSSQNYRLQEGVIKRNQNLSEILSPFSVSNDLILKIAIASKKIYDVRRFRANSKFDVVCSKDSIPEAKCLVYHPNKIDYVVYDISDKDSIKVAINHMPVDTVEHTLSGIINNSLYATIVEKGGSPALAHKLSEVYAWQIDFFSISKGDEFEVVYEEKLVEGKPVGIGHIKAARFKHNSENYFAFQFKDDSTTKYYDQEGNSLEKAFLKAPLKFSRISSHFSHSRLHPVLKIRRPHHGVDYAAPRGTEVHAIGDGTVLLAHYSGGAGNYIKIRHNSVYTTGYMHLWKYAPGIKPGVKVKQGQLIGYVGSTGISTGPHLDFRFWKNGEAIDPLKVEPPSVEPLKREYIGEFDKIKRAYLTKIQHLNSHI